MKRLFLSMAIIACVSFTMTISAQNKGNRGKSPIMKELNLSTEQQQKVESINKEYKTKIGELKAKSDLSKEDKQSKMKELRTQKSTAINNILTPEQQSKFKEMENKRGKKDMGSLKGKKSAMKAPKGKDIKMRAQRGERMKNLNLTDDQKQKIKNLNDDFKTKNKELAQQHREALNNVYTPEQQAKLKEMRSNFAKDRKGRKHSFSHRGNNKKGINMLDEASKSKLKTLKENFEKEKKAVELSRIAPDAQKQKISDLRKNFKKEKRQIITDARKNQDNKVGA